MDNPQVTKAFNSQVGTSEAIHGDGYFHLTKKGYASLEITMDLRDEHALQIVKNVYGGSIKLVSGANALRYCLRHKAGFLALVNDVNGLIRTGFFDADGSISINTTNGQLSISIAQKTAEMLYPLVELYGEDILNIIEYFKKYPARSAKKNRLHLIPKCYELKDLKAHKALPGTLLNKS
ncbi:intronic ORF at intron 3 of nad1 [Tuber brumale]|nr:intronic ORF at intron 3 of nad1 [Tuber brumale]